MFASPSVSCDMGSLVVLRRTTTRPPCSVTLVMASFKDPKHCSLRDLRVWGQGEGEDGEDGVSRTRSKRFVQFRVWGRTRKSQRNKTQARNAKGEWTAFCTEDAQSVWEWM